MAVVEYVLDAIAQNRRGLVGMVSGLTAEQLAWRPGPEANPIGFMTWHLFRFEDDFVHARLGGGLPVWERGGWSVKWPQRPRPENASPLWPTGNSWTPREVSEFRAPPLEEVLAYGQAERESAVAIIKTLDDTSLDQPINSNNPQANKGLVLRVITLHELEHLGHIEMLLGLMKAKG